MNSARIFSTLRILPALAATLLLAEAALVDAQVPPPNAAVEYDAQLCRDLGGDLETSGGGAEVCSNLDANDTFCVIGEQQALPCRGLFKHVITCNAAHNRPALNPFFCGARCGGETPLARGDACEKPIADLDAVVSRAPATITAASGFVGPAYVVRASVDYELRDFETDSDVVSLRGATVILLEKFSEDGAAAAATIAAKALCDGCYPAFVTVVAAFTPLLAPDQPRPDAEVGVSITGVTFVAPTEAAGGTFSLLGAERGGAALAAGALTVDSAAGELSGLLSGAGAHVVSVAYESAAAPGEPGHFLGTLELLMTVNAQWPPGSLLEPPTPTQSRLVAPSYAGSVAFFRGGDGVRLTLAPDISSPGFAVPAGVFVAPEGFTVALTDALAGGGAKTIAFTIAARAPGGVETAVPVTVAAIPLLAPAQPRPDAEVGVSITGVTFAVPTEAAGGTFSLLGAEWGGAALAGDALTVDSAVGELSGLLSGVGEYVVSVAYETAVAPGEPGHFLGTLALLMTVNAQGPLLDPNAPAQSRLVAPSYAGSVAFFRGTEGVRLTLAPDISPPGFGVPAGVFVAPEGFTVALTDALAGGGAKTIAFTIAARAPGGAETAVPVTVAAIPLLAPDQPRPDAKVGVSISGVTFAVPTEAAGGIFSLLGAEWGGVALAADALTVDSAVGELSGLLSGVGEYVVSVAYETAAAPGEPGHFLGTLALLMTVNAQGPLLEEPALAQSRLVAPTYAGSVAFFRGTEGVRLTLAPDISSPGFGVPAGVFVAPEGFTVALTDALAGGGAKTIAFTIAARAPGGAETAVPVTVAAIPLLAPDQPRPDAKVGVSISGVTFAVPTEAAGGIFSLLGAEWGGAALAADALTVDSAVGELSGLLSGVGEYVVSVAYETAAAPGEPGHFLGTLALLMTVNAQGPLLEEPALAQSRLVAPTYAGSVAFFRGTEGVRLTLAPDISSPGFGVPAGVFVAPEGFTVALTDALAGGGAKTIAFTIAARAPGGAETAVPVTVAAIPLLAPEQQRPDAEVGVSISGVTFAVPTEAAGGIFSLLGAEWGGVALAADALTVDAAVGELSGLLSGVGEYVVSVAYETAVAPGEPGHFLGTLALLMTVNAQGPLLEPPAPAQSRLVAPTYAGSVAFFRGTEGVRLTLAPDISSPGFAVPAGVFVAPEGFTVALTDALAGGGGKTAAFTIAVRAPGRAETAVPVTVAAIPLLAPEQPRPETTFGVSISGVTFVAPAEASGGVFSLIGAERGGVAVAAGALAVDPATGELSGLPDNFGDYVVSVAYEESGRFLGTLALLMTVNSGGAALEAGAFVNLPSVSPTYTGSVAFFRGAEGVTLTLAPDISPPGFSIPAGVFAAPEGLTVLLTEAVESGQARVAAFTLAIRTSNGAEALAPVTIMVQALTTGNLPDVVLREGPATSPGARVTVFSLPGHPQAVYSETSDPDDRFTIRAGGELAVGTAALAAEQYAPAVHTLAMRAESESFLGTADFELRVIVDFAALKELPPPAWEFAMKVSVAATTAGNDAEEVKRHVDSLLRGFDRRLQGLEDNWESADLRGALLAAAIGSAAGQPAADAEAAREILTMFYDFRLAPPPEGKARFAHHNLLRLGITLTVEGVENVLLGDDPGHRHNSFRQPRKITAEYAGYHRGAHYIYTTGPRSTTGNAATKGALIRDAGTFPNGYQENFCAAGGRGWRVVTFDELQGFRYYTKDDDNDLFKHDGVGGASIGGNLNAPLPGAFKSEARIVPIFPNHPKAVTMNLPSNIYGPAGVSEVNSFYESVFIDFYSALTLSPTGHHVPLRIQTANNLKRKLESEDPDSENLRGRIVCVLPDVDGEYDRPPPHSEVYYRANGRELVDTIDSTTGEVREIQATVLAGGGAFLTVTAAAYRLVRTGVEWLLDQNLTVSLRANLSVSMAVEPLEAGAGKGVVRLIFSTQDAGLAGELYILTKTPRQVYFGSTNVLGVEEKGVYVLRVRVSSSPVVSTRTEGGQARQSFAGRVSSRRLDATAPDFMRGRAERLRLRRGASVLELRKRWPRRPLRSVASRQRSRNFGGMPRLAAEIPE